MAETSHSERTAWDIQWASPEDTDALLALFERAFGEPMDQRMWQWKYAGRELSGMLARRGGEAVAYYGGLPRELHCGEQRFSGAQICDVMVDPAARGILTRRGAFRETASAFLEQATGTDKQHLTAFGFPSARAAALGERLGLYCQVDDLLEVSWHVQPKRQLPLWWQARPVQAQAVQSLAPLWSDMRQVMPDVVIPTKSPEFLTHRYLEHPIHDYMIWTLGLRLGSAPRGALVVRDHPHMNRLELVDLLGPPARHRQLLACALDLTRRMQRESLFAWLTPRVLDTLPTPDAQERVGGVYLAGPERERLAKQWQARWWLMAGDTDFR